MASGHVNRIKRPNTWLHRPMLQNVKKALANPEPSTHGTSRRLAALQNLVAIGAGCVKTFFLPQKLHATGDYPRRHDGLSIFLLGRVQSQPGRKLGPH
ncbi:hypothetical protein V1282_000157 [Nitrobacteraceae bacterium AZCC 2146]